jgi:hypothetical protein
MSENVGASTSRKPLGLHGLYKDTFIKKKTVLPFYVDVSVNVGVKSYMYYCEKSLD